MLIDPFTTIAQIINFLILVALLKRFLYAPITQAMTKREQLIADRLQSAANKEADAEAEAARYRQLQTELSDAEEERYARMHEQVEAKRQALLSQAQTEVEQTRAQWYASLQQEKQSFLRSLWQQTSQQLANTVRQTLLDLAGADLEQQVVGAFIQRLQHLSEGEQRSLQAALSDDYDGPGVVISTTSDLAEPLQQQLRDAVQQQAAAVTARSLPITFKTHPDPLCGLELQVSGYKLSWSLAQYLQQLETRLGQLLDEQQPTPAPRRDEPRSSGIEVPGTKAQGQT